MTPWAEALKANLPCIWMTVSDEARFLVEAAHTIKAFNGDNITNETVLWSSTTGGVSLDEYVDAWNGKPPPVDQASMQLHQFLINIVSNPAGNGAYYFILDAGHEINNIATVRRVKDFVRHHQSFRRKAGPCTLVLVSNTDEVPKPLNKDVDKVFYQDLPTIDMIQSLLDDVRQEFIAGGITTKRIVADVLAGLEMEEATNVFRLQMIRTVKRLEEVTDEEATAIVADLVQSTREDAVVRTDGVLSWVKPAFDFSHLAGFDVFKKWAHTRANTWLDPEFPPIGGIMVLGVPGCGKSMGVECLGSKWGIPILSLDLSRVFQKHLGNSEARIRMALRTAEACAPVILWIDEGEKDLSGQASSDSTDGGTTSRVFATILKWQQDHMNRVARGEVAPVIPYMTVNRAGSLPAELIRRYPNRFFVDLPTRTMTREAIEIHLRLAKRDSADFDVDALLGAAGGLTPDDIRHCIGDAIFESGGRSKLSTECCLTAFKDRPRLSQIATDQIAEIRDWAGIDPSTGRGRNAVLATTPDPKQPGGKKAAIGKLKGRKT